MKVPFNNLLPQYLMYKKEYDEAVIKTLESGWYILGNQVSQFEKEFAEYTGAEYAVGCANGLDALVMAVRTMNVKKNDKIIVAANTYIATVMGITMNDCIPVFVEPDEFYNLDPEKIESSIDEDVKGIMVTHLYGQAANMSKIMEIAKKYNLFVIEDCAQAHGATHRGKMVGTFGDIGCYSFYPSKNMGCFGDGGAIITNYKAYADNIIMLRNYGSKVRYENEEVGYNSRLDEMQAALLRIKLKHICELQDERVKIAERFLSEINNDKIILPKTCDLSTHVYHLFVVRVKERKEFLSYLEEKEIGYQIHYPIPPHLSKAYNYLGHKKGDFPISEKYADQVVSLPIYNGMSMEEVDYVIESLNNF